jgi:hypothetical protein
MRLLIDAMLPPSTCGLLVDRGHDAITPTGLGAHALSDDTLIEIAGTDNWVVVTENAVDFVHATSCTVLLGARTGGPATPSHHASPTAWTGGRTLTPTRATGPTGSTPPTADRPGPTPDWIGRPRS